jgi:hypothetical protein
LIAVERVVVPGIKPISDNVLDHCTAPAAGWQDLNT